MQKFKVNDQSTPKIEWIQTDGQTVGDDCITSRLMRLVIISVNSTHRSYRSYLYQSVACHKCSLKASFCDSNLRIIYFDINFHVAYTTKRNGSVPWNKGRSNNSQTSAIPHCIKAFFFSPATFKCLFTHHK